MKKKRERDLERENEGGKSESSSVKRLEGRGRCFYSCRKVQLSQLELDSSFGIKNYESGNE